MRRSLIFGILPILCLLVLTPVSAFSFNDFTNFFFPQKHESLVLNIDEGEVLNSKKYDLNNGVKKNKNEEVQIETQTEKIDSEKIVKILEKEQDIENNDNGNVISSLSFEEKGSNLDIVSSSVVNCVFSGGSGIEEDPFQLSTVSDLKCLRDDVNEGNNYINKYLSLVNDISFSSSDYNDPLLGWEGIGIFSVANLIHLHLIYPFSGNFNGGGFKVINLFISRANDDFIGFFGFFNGEINNFELENVNIVGEDYVGGLIGYNKGGVINDSYSEGDVNGEDYVGGLIGFNSGRTVRSSFSSGDVGGNIYVGGLIGYNKGVVSDSFSSASVSGNTYVGGLVGVNYEGVVRGSYNSGVVTSLEHDTGSLIGGNGGEISSSYNEGNVYGEDNVGGLIGYNKGGVINDSYYDITVAGNLGDYGKTIEELQVLKTSSNLYSNWAYHVWVFEEGYYPYLKSFDYSDFVDVGIDSVIFEVVGGYEESTVINLELNLKGQINENLQISVSNGESAEVFNLPFSNKISLTSSSFIGKSSSKLRVELLNKKIHPKNKKVFEKTLLLGLKEVIEGHNNINDDRINLVFSGVNFENEIVFKEKVRDLLSWDDRLTFGFFAAEPMYSNRHKFNIWYFEEILNFDESGSSHDFLIESNNKMIEDYYNIPFLATVNIANDLAIFKDNDAIGGGFAQGGRSINFLDFNKNDIFFRSVFISNNNHKILFHELGHSIFKLGDEYSSNSDTPGYVYPNCVKNKAEAKLIWSDLVGDIDPYLYTWYDLAKMENSDIKDISYYEDLIKVGYNYGGCYSSNENSDVIRPTKSSIMNNPSFFQVLGSVNRRRVEKILSFFEGVNPKLVNENREYLGFGGVDSKSRVYDNIGGSRNDNGEYLGSGGVDSKSRVYDSITEVLDDVVEKEIKEEIPKIVEEVVDLSYCETLPENIRDVEEECSKDLSDEIVKRISPVAVVEENTKTSYSGGYSRTRKYI